jgi:capsular polysaccharide transport system permease protein
MAKDFWGIGTGSSATSADADAVSADRPAALPAHEANTAPVNRAITRPRIPDMPSAALRKDAPVALDEIERKSKAAEPAPRGERRVSGISLPAAARSVPFGRRLWFIASVAAPLVLGFIYLFLIAPDIYITEYRFSVRVPVGQQAASPSSGGSLAALFGGNPSPGADTLDNFTVVDYVSSVQAARDLDAKVGLRAMFDKPSDPFSKLGSKASAERLASYWQSMVFSSYDVTTGLAVVRVRAYTASDSYAIANNLINLSTDLVNSSGVHSQQDTLRFAQQQHDRAAMQVAALRGELVNLRRQTNVVDPTKDALAVNQSLVTDLAGRRAQAQEQLAAMTQQLHNAKAPQVAMLQQRIDAIDAQLRQARSSGGVPNGGQNIAVTVGKFEAVNDKLLAAQTVLAETTQALSQAQTSAEAQRLYLATYVRPVQPESPQEPDRWRDLLIIALVSGMVWMIGRLIGNSIMEHA